MANIPWLIISVFLLFGSHRPCKSQEANEQGDWRIIPRLSVGATYSDNISLAPADEINSDIVLQVEPGVSIHKQGGRINLRLDYAAQGLLYTNNGDANKVNNNLLAFGTAELYQKSLFIDAYSSITQVPISSQGRVDVGNLGLNSGNLNGGSLLNFNNLNSILPNADDLFNPIGIFSNIALTDNQTTQFNFGISPYWRQTFGGCAEMLLRYRYADVSYSSSDNSTDQLSGLSDSQINTIEVNLASGARSNVLRWNLNYFYQQQDNQQNDTQDIGNNREELLTGEMKYSFNRAWTLLSKAGYANNQSSTYEDNVNGPYWGLGVAWLPNRFYSLAGLYGLNFNEVTVQINPLLNNDPVTGHTDRQRTHLQISRAYQGVGYNPGVYWNGSFNHRTRNSNWSATYIQEVTTAQQLAINSLIVGPDGNPIDLDEQGQILNPDGPFGQNSQQFLRKYFNINASYLRGPHTLGLNAFSDNREFQDPTLDQDNYGVGVTWIWRFAPRTASFFGTGWEHDVLSNDQQNNYWVSVIGLARIFTPDSGGLISYRYYQNDGDPSSESFRENRLNIRFNMKF